MKDYLRVGVISSTHGLKGEVKVFSTTDNIERFQSLKKCILDTGKEYLELEVEGVKFFKQFAILKFKGFDKIEQIEKYRGKDLLVTREDAVELKEGEFFITDLIGCKVIKEDGAKIGELTDVLKTGANDVFEVKTLEGKQLLLPYIDECIKSIDLEKEEITVYLMPGLAD